MALGPIAQHVFGLATFIPGFTKLVFKGTGGTDSARYCYSVWLRHLVMARKRGLNVSPRVVAELGPGDSLGIGLAALLSGAEAYWAFDVLEHADLSRNIAILDELVTLFRDRTPIPGADEFPSVKPVLADHAFPHDILSSSRLDMCLADGRVDRIRQSLEASGETAPMIRYCVPWFDREVVQENSVDMIFSQAVLEHVDDLVGAYTSMKRWLKPGGVMSHQIDFRCHGTAREWNGHWKYSDLRWRLIRGKRPYLLNRQPHSVHTRIVREQGFEIIGDDPVREVSAVDRRQLAPRFRELSDVDLTTCGAFVQALKPL